MYIKCKICDKKINSLKGLSSHIGVHNINKKEYYDTYMKEDGEGKCYYCKVETIFHTITKGYSKMCRKCSYGVTKEKCILRHGEIKGKKVWEDYCKKQSLTNSFEYKKEKYGWTKEQFNEYNSSRSQTKENMIFRYGEQDGLKKWNEYCETQKYAGSSKEYFIDKYGEQDGLKKWKEVNSKKTHTLESYIKKYGEDEGFTKYEKYCKDKRVGFYSKSSMKLFKNIDETIEGKFYYGLNEYGIMNNNGTYFKYDFVSHELKKIIEFNGVCFHPKSIDDTEWKNPYDSSITVEQAYKKDQEKKTLAVNKGFEVLYVWEDYYNKNEENVLNECINFLRKK